MSKATKLFKYIKSSFHCPICNIEYETKQQVKDHIVKHDDSYIEEYYNFYVVNNCDNNYLNVGIWLDDKYMLERRVMELLNEESD